MLIAALAYRYARKHANDRRFVFDTGKLGDLAGFTSAVILAMIALLIGYINAEKDRLRAAGYYDPLYKKVWRRLRGR